MKIIFKKLKKDNILSSEFNDFSENNCLEFEGTQSICTLYAPNGVGKSTLASILKVDNGTTYEIEKEGQIFTQKEDFFHVISDQNNRNIISGEEEDFLLGDEVYKEITLKKEIDKKFDENFRSISKELKSRYLISVAKDNLVADIIKGKDEKLANYLSSIANIQDKGKNINKKDFIEYIKEKKELGIVKIKDDTEINKLAFWIKDMKKPNSIIKIILTITEDITANYSKQVVNYERNTDAVNILQKHCDLNECLICDSEINSMEILAKKKKRNEEIMSSIDERTQKILQLYAQNIDAEDHFGIKDRLRKTFVEKDFSQIEALVDELNTFNNKFYNEVTNLLITSFSKEIILKHAEYIKIVEKRVKITGEDLELIESIVKQYMGKELKIERKKDGNIKISVDAIHLLGTDRSKMALSTGEQNFLSLAFEFIKAKNSPKEIIVLDDPISSFDSIYKNKISYFLTKVLKDKKIILLTHNLDAIRLIEFQKNGISKFYLYHNKLDHNNGFHYVEIAEKDVLLNLDKFIAFLRMVGEENMENKIIANDKLFLFSIVPFMRMYAGITGKENLKQDMHTLMHGYNDKKSYHNIGQWYETLFANNKKSCFSNEKIKLEEIMDFDFTKETKILNGYPLINRALKHSAIYLYLRLKTESVLASKFDVDTNKHERLSPIVCKAFETNYSEYRVFFMSRKTLLNEFNHFEGNFSIFQPAIDISDDILLNEQIEIVEKLAEIEALKLS